MRTNPIKQSEVAIQKLITNTFSKLIPRVWRLNYEGTRALMRNRDDSVTIQVKHDTVVGLTLLLSKSHLEVVYRDTSYHVDWYLDPRTGQPTEFLVGSNWNSAEHLFPLVVETLVDHCIQISQQVQLG